MFKLLPILENHLFINNSIEGKVKDLEYFYKYSHRDFGLDDKYVTYTVVKRDPNDWRTSYKDVKISLGKYLTKFFNLTPSEITHMCEKYKSLINNHGTFEIIDGDDLVNAYYHKNYYKHSGTLGNSCMRYKKCQDLHFFDIYKHCAKMIVMRPNKGSRIMGRAIIWPYGDTYLMDRVYTVENYIEHQFYEYAKKQGWYILDKNAYVGTGQIQLWKTPQSNYKATSVIDYTIEASNIKYLPYMDSVCYINKFNETALKISTIPKESESNYCAHCTNGRFFRVF